MRCMPIKLINLAAAAAGDTAPPGHLSCACYIFGRLALVILIAWLVLRRIPRFGRFARTRTASNHPERAAGAAAARIWRSGRGVLSSTAIEPEVRTGHDARPQSRGNGAY